MALEKEYVGTELKYLVTIQAGEFGFDDIELSFEITCGKVKITKGKADLIIDEQNKIYLTIDTAMFPKGGDLYVNTTIGVPDDDFPDGFKTEIKRTLLKRIEKIK